LKAWLLGLCLLGWLPADGADWERFVAERFGKGMENYQPPSHQQMQQLEALSEGDLMRVHQHEHGLIFEPLEERGWGLLLQRDHRSGWILEVPHPVADRHTATLAWQLYQWLPFDAMILGGCHRRNRADGCSDLAHTEESAFMAWHRALTRQPSTVVFQLHGFEASKGRTHPMPPDLAFIVADGSGSAPQHGPAAQLFEALQGRHRGVLAGPAHPWMMATTNAQKRDLEARARGPFVHLELDSSLRQPEHHQATLNWLRAGLGRAMAPAQE
jgi:hypothetical protein